MNKNQLLVSSIFLLLIFSFISPVNQQLSLVDEDYYPTEARDDDDYCEDTYEDDEQGCINDPLCNPDYEDDGEALASAGFGTDEDYGYYGD